MKKIFLLLTFSLFVFPLFSQQWSAMGTGLNGTGHCATFYNGNLIVGGQFTTAGGNPASNIVMWDGANWNPLGTGVNGQVNALAVYHNQLYACGSFSNAGGVPVRKIARWNGTSWDSVGHGVNGVFALALNIFQDKLIIGGRFSTAGNTPVQNIAAWNDTTWSALGTGIYCSWSTTDVHALEIFQNELYVGGQFNIAGQDSTAYCIARWNGSTWNHADFGMYDRVLTFAYFGGYLYAGGEFTANGNGNPMAHISRWDGTSWGAVSTGTDNNVESMYAYGNQLYIGGFFLNAGGNSAAHIVSWDGSNFNPMAGGTDGNVLSVTADEGIVYATGAFINADGNSASKIAKWSAVGVGINTFSENEAPIIYPNPSNGIFSVVLKNNYQNSEIEIYNSIGEKVSAVEVKNEITELNLSNESSGIYFYRVSSNGKLVSEGKIMKE